MRGWGKLKKGILMKKVFLIVVSMVSFVMAESVGLQYGGVYATHIHHDGSEEDVELMRVMPEECFDGVNISVEHIFGGKHAASEIPEACKKTFVATVGKVTPMQIAKGVKTVGELEVLDFINKMSESPQAYLLIDSRMPNWYESGTIPGAVNLPYNAMEFDMNLKEDYLHMLQTLSIKEQNGKLDFSNVKKILLFCNASWCGQSPSAIKILLKLGYPAEKILWYRGGLQSWLSLGFNTIKPK